jgi:hypothetical protein
VILVIIKVPRKVKSCEELKQEQIIHKQSYQYNSMTETSFLGKNGQTAGKVMNLQLDVYVF